MLTTTQALLSVLVIAGATFLTRALPFWLFPSNKQTPAAVLYLGKVLPFAIIGMLVVYCLKETAVWTYPYGLPQLIAIEYIVLVHKWKHNLILSIGGGTVLYMVLVQVIFV